MARSLWVHRELRLSVHAVGAEVLSMLPLRTALRGHGSTAAIGIDALLRIGVGPDLLGELGRSVVREWILNGSRIRGCDALDKSSESL